MKDTAALRANVLSIVLTVTGLATFALWATPIPSGHAARRRTATGRPVGIAADYEGSGYWVAESSGQVTAEDGASVLASPHKNPSVPIVAIAADPQANGYFLAARNGAVYAFGAARFHGSARRRHLASPVAGIAVTPRGNGYWLVTADGHVYAFGSAESFGSLQSRPSSPVVGIAASSSGKGYFLATSSGTIYPSDTGTTCSILPGAVRTPVAAITRVPRGGCFQVVSRSGSVYPNTFAVDPRVPSPPTPVIAMAVAPERKGYWLLSGSGTVTAFGEVSAPAHN